MAVEALFTCHLIKVDNEKVGDWQKYQVQRIFLDGETDILSEGCYYACRSSIDRYYHHLNRQQDLYMVYWCDETQFEVYDSATLKQCRHAAA